MNLGFICYKELSANQKILYLYLLEKAQQGASGISLEQIGNELGMVKSTVNICIKALEKVHALKKEKQLNEYGGTTYNRYILYRFENGTFTETVEATL